MYPIYDPYAILGVPVTAEIAEIKRVFRHLAKHHHPDLNPHDIHAVERFQEINKAYETLIALKTAPQPGYYPPYPPYPYYPPQGYQQAPPQPQTAPQETEFQAYAWEPIEIKQEDMPPPVTPVKKVEIVEEPVVKDYTSVPWREDMVEVAYEESVRDAKDRVLRKKFSPEEQLAQEIMIYLLRGKTRPPVRHSNSNKS